MTMQESKPSFINSLCFHISFYAVTLIFMLICGVLAIIPGRKPMMVGLLVYTRIIRFLMGALVDIEIEYIGKERLPKEGAYIFAPKHQSYGDGYLLFSEFFDLSFVAGDAIAKLTIMKTILRKMGAVVIDNCGGSEVQEQMTAEVARVKAENRKLFIYPEGHLSEIGTHHRYRKGVYHMYKDFDCPVVPVATNLGQRWNQEDFMKYPGRATLEFLEPIMPGLDKETFMERLQTAIETRSIALLDMENLGALNPDNIGVEKENSVAKAKREAREAHTNDIEGATTQRPSLDRGAAS